MEKEYSSPLITNDGATIAKDIDLKDPYSNAGVEMLKEVASKTNEVAGDGTTTATILAQEILNEGMRAIDKGGDPVAIKKGIDKTVEYALKEINKQSESISGKEQIAMVASISSGDVEVGKTIAEAMEKVTEDGVITVEESQTAETHVDIVQGMQFDKGYISPYMITDAEKQEAVLDSPYILVTDQKINNIKDIIGLLEQVASESKKLLLIAEDVETDILSTLILNKLRRSYKCNSSKSTIIW